jgi:hypothetical protein
MESPSVFAKGFDATGRRWSFMDPVIVMTGLTTDPVIRDDGAKRRVNHAYGG